MIVLPAAFTILTVIAMVIYYMIFGATRPIVFVAESTIIVTVCVGVMIAVLRRIWNRL